MLENKPRKGLLIVVSGPSGTGKGTICGQVREQLPNLGYSVSATTRGPRTGEVDGKSYFFKTVAAFEEMIATGELLEYANVYGNYYGTPKQYVLDILAQGQDVLLEIDVQGAMQVKENYPEAVLVFIAPPSLKELRARLEGRGTDAQEVIERRLQAATGELKLADKYDYIVVNDVLEAATAQVLAVLAAERCNAKRNLDVVEALIK